MSAQVDVLAITREMRERRVNNGKHTSPTLIAWADRIDAAVAALIAERDALLVIARDFDEVLREKGLRCECGELDCRTSRLDAALARVQGRFDTPSGHDVGCVEHPPGFAQTCSCGARAQGVQS